MDFPVSQLHWPQYHRIISSAHPPIDLFEDIADPEDCLLLGAAEGKTSPRLSESIGELDKVPAQRRVGGVGSSYVMAPFTHISPDRPGRFHDGHFGAFYSANRFETAVLETVHHRQLFCQATAEAPGWIADLRELVGEVNTQMVELRGGGFEALLDKDGYAASQTFARQRLTESVDGVVYPSVRDEEGECFAAFYPDVMGIPVQGQHLSYHWDGERVDQVKIIGASPKVYRVIKGASD